METLSSLQQPCTCPKMGYQVSWMWGSKRKWGQNQCPLLLR